MSIAGSIAAVRGAAKQFARESVAFVRGDKSTELRPSLPHQRPTGTLGRLAERLGEDSELTTLKSALRAGETVAADDVLIAVQANSLNRSDILRSKLAHKVIEIAKSGLKPAQTQILESGLLAELRSELPQDVALQAAGGHYDRATTLAAGNEVIIEKLDFLKAIAGVLKAKGNLAKSKEGELNHAKDTKDYQLKILDLAQALLDPESKKLLGARNHKQLEDLRLANPTKSRHVDALEQLKTGDEFHKAMYHYLDHLGVVGDLGSLRGILENPYSNKQHQLLQDSSRQGLRLFLADQLIRKDYDRLKKDTVCPGFLGSLRESLFNAGFDPVQITKAEIDALYGNDKDHMQINPHRTDYTFRLDRFVTDLMAGTVGAPTSSAQSGYTTKSGAVVQLLETYAVLEKRYHLATDDVSRSEIAHQKQLLKTLITDESSSLLPPAVYKQIQHVFNNDTMVIYPNLVAIGKQMSGYQEKAQIDNEVAELKSRHEGFGTILDQADKLEPAIGNPSDPKSFFNATMEILQVQSDETARYASAVEIAIGTQAQAVKSSLAAKKDVVKDLLYSSTQGQAAPKSVDALFKEILDEDKSIANSEGKNGGGPLARLLFNNSQKLDEARLRSAIEAGTITPQDVFVDGSGSDRKLVGLAYLLNKIETSGYPATVKTEAKQKIFDALLTDPAKVTTTMRATAANNTVIQAIAGEVPKVSAMEKRSLDTLGSLHNVIVAKDASPAQFQHNFFKEFSRDAEHATVLQTWAVIHEVAKGISKSLPMDKQLQLLRDGLADKGRTALADSVNFMLDPINYDANSNLLRVMLDFVKSLGFTKFVEGIERFLNVSEQKKTTASV
jgi:hypothetical protein